MLTTHSIFEKYLLNILSPYQGVGGPGSTWSKSVLNQNSLSYF